MSADTSQSTPEQDALLRAEIDRSLRHPVMFFFTSGAAWLAVSLLLGLISSLKVNFPGLLSHCSWFTYGRIFAAHTTCLIYGWAFQAAFGAIIWLMARLSRQTCRAAGVILTAGHVWNVVVSLGVIGILGGQGTGKPWMEMPVFAWIPMILCYFAIVIWSMVQFKVRPAGHVYISQWYLLAALIWLPWVFLTAHLLIYGFAGNPVMAAGINAWYRSGILLLFLLPVAIGSAYYLVPKVSGRPVHSYSLSMLGFWSLAVIAPWAGMQKLAGAPISYWLPAAGAAATILFGIPAIAVGFNLLKTAYGNPDAVTNSPTLRFTVAGIISLVVLGLSGVLLNMPGGLRVSQFSFSNYGYELMAIYGCFSFVAFGLMYFVVPRLTTREWLSSRLIKLHFMPSVYGVAMLVLFTLFGGLMQGQGGEEYSLPWESAAIRTYPYAVGTTVVWALLLISNFFFFIHLALMWLRLGRRSSHPTLLGVAHHGDLHDSTHGPEGDIDNAGPGSAPAHSH